MSVITRTAAIAALLLASACSGQPEVLEPDPTATSSTPGPKSPPPLPPAAEEFSPSGAATYVQYWVDTFNFAAMTGDATQLKSISTSCDPCAAYAKDFEALTEDERATEPPWEIKSVAASEASEPILITAKVNVARDSSGAARTLQFALSKGDPFTLDDIRELE